MRCMILTKEKYDRSEAVNIECRECDDCCSLCEINDTCDVSCLLDDNIRCWVCGYSN